MKNISPYKNSYKTKKEQVAYMFDEISSKYDFMNRIISLNLDKLWRKKVVKKIKKHKPKKKER